MQTTIFFYKLRHYKSNPHLEIGGRKSCTISRNVPERVITIGRRLALDKPHFLFECSDRKPLSILLASVFLLTTVLSGPAPSQRNQADENDMMRNVVQYLIQVGTEQYQHGYYIQAEKTLLMAQGYQEYLTSAQRNSLSERLEEAHLAALERKRALDHLQAARQLVEQGQLAQAKSHLDKVKGSKFLVEKERVQVDRLLQQVQTEPMRPMGELEQEKSAPPQGIFPVDEGPEQPLVQAKSRDEQIAATYYRSLRLYRSGRFEEAREGFLDVRDSGLIPPLMEKTIEGYLGRIDAVLGPRPAEAQAPAATQTPAGPPVAETPVPSQGQMSTEPQEPTPTFERAAPTPVREMVPPFEPGEADVSMTQVAEPAPEPAQSSYIEMINQRRNIIRGLTRAVVNNAMNEAEQYIQSGKFEKAHDVVNDAQRKVEEYQLQLGDTLYRQYSKQLEELDQRIDRAEQQTAEQLDQQKRQEAIQAQREFRQQMEAEKQERIKSLMQNAKAYQQQQRYEAALGQLETLLALDPQHEDALILKDTLEDTVYFRKQLQVQKEAAKQRADILLETDRSGIPYADELTYPKNWREIIQKPTRQPDKPIGLDPADVAVYEQLDQIVDLSQLSPTMPLSEAMDIIRNSVEPPLRIAVMWRDLFDNAEVEQTTPINMDGLPAVRLGTALENLLEAVSGGFADIGYVVEDGVITVATVESLPIEERLVLRVYDITDLVGEPAQYGGIQGLYMGQQLGMMMGGGMGGYGGYGGGMGGYGGGMGGYGGGGYGGMGGYGGGGYGGMGGMGMGGMGMGGYGMGGMGMGSYISRQQAFELSYLIQNTVGREDDWAYDDRTGFTWGTGYGTVTPYPENQPKKLAVKQTPELHAKIEELLTGLRRRLGYQVAIEARFLVVSENFLEDIGLDVDFIYNLGGKWGTVTVEQGSEMSARADVATKVPGSLGGMSPAATLTGGYGSILDDLQVSFLLRMTQARSDAETLTAPKATVLSGESANFSVQSQVSYALPPDIIRSTTRGFYAGGGIEDFGIQQNVFYIPVGSVLTITPIITPDKKNVLLNIITQLQELLRLRTHTVAGLIDTDGADGEDGQQLVEYPVTVPETETSQIMTRVSVPDGGTLLLGGQKITAEVEKEVGVPILSKIPVIGLAFGNRSKIKDHKILLILVKPTIILQEERESEAIAALESEF